MSEQYRCKTCGYTFDMKDMMCSECGEGYFDQLRWTKGGDGSHWDGCEDVHWDCKIAQLEADNAILTAELSMQKSLVAAREQDLNELHIELSQLRERTRWIPVSERLPDHKQSVLAVADREVTNTYYDVNFRKWSQSKHYWFPEGEVTHWMPLPEPPEDSDAENQ